MPVFETVKGPSPSTLMSEAAIESHVLGEVLAEISFIFFHLFYKPTDRELLIRHTAICVNYHDIYVRLGLYKTLNLLGIPGYEAIGIIETIGPCVKYFKAGDRIVYITSGYVAYATHRILSDHLVTKVPDMVSDKIMATNFLRRMTVKILLEKV